MQMIFRRSQNIFHIFLDNRLSAPQLPINQFCHFRVGKRSKSALFRNQPFNGKLWSKPLGHFLGSTDFSGFVINNVYPGRLGFVNAVRLSRHRKHPCRSIKTKLALNLVMDFSDLPDDIPSTFTKCSAIFSKLRHQKVCAPRQD